MALNIIQSINLHRLYFANRKLLSATKNRITGIKSLPNTIPSFNDPEKEVFLKTLWEKEKMLVTSIFSFCRNIFYPISNINH